MTIKELKETAEQLATARGISTQQAADIIRDYKGDPRELLAGSHGKAGATCSKTPKRRTQKKEYAGRPIAQTRTINKVVREISQDIQDGKPFDYLDTIQSDLTPELLPVGLHDDIVAIIEGFANTHDIKDIYKIDPRQFGAICMQVGTMIKQRGILRDREREKRDGGMYYSGDKLEELLRLYGYICDEFRQVAFMFNFQRFSGVSYEYFHDYENRLTASRADILKKSGDIQRASITASIASNTGNVVGNIFLGKALAGLQETVTVQHVTTATAPASGSLPVFDTVAGGLIEQKGE